MITLLYAGFCTLLVLLLAIRVAHWRFTHKIGLGDGGDKELLAAIRAHANLIELAPLTLLLIWLMHGPRGHLVPDILAIVLVIARLLHAGGMLGYVPYGRPAGSIGTSVVLAWASVTLIVTGLAAL